MKKQIKKIRQKYGNRISNKEFRKIFDFTVMKARMFNDDDYIVLLLPDSIDEYLCMLNTRKRNERMRFYEVGA